MAMTTRSSMIVKAWWRFEQKQNGGESPWSMRGDDIWESSLIGFFRELSVVSGENHVYAINAFYAFYEINAINEFNEIYALNALYEINEINEFYAINAFYEFYAINAVSFC
jgi:hypothetical protein